MVRTRLPQAEARAVSNARVAGRLEPIWDGMVSTHEAREKERQHVRGVPQEPALPLRE